MTQPIIVRLCDADGKPVNDSKADFSSLLELVDRQKIRYLLLSGVDPYGDTVFNQLQMKRLLEEITDLSAGVQTEEQRKAAIAIRDVALQCQKENHRYLKFFGA